MRRTAAADLLTAAARVLGPKRRLGARFVNRAPRRPSMLMRPHSHPQLPRSCADESIDEIAAFLGVGEKVAEMTAQ